MFAEDKKIVLKEINDEMRQSFLAYSMSVIIQRALCYNIFAITVIE